MESLTKNRKNREQIAQMVARAFNDTSLAHDDTAIIELKDGWFNVAYLVTLSDGQETVLKIAPAPDAEIMTYEIGIMNTEVAMMRLVAQNPAIPAPKIYYFDTQQDLCDSPYFFMEKFEGENLEQIRTIFPPEMQSQIDYQVGEIIREVNRFTGTYFGYEGNPALRGDTWKETFIKIMEAVLADGIRKQADYGIAVDTIHKTLLKHAPALEPVQTPHLVHWDAWELNFFAKDGRVNGIIDFERALWGDPLMEVQFRTMSWGGISDSLRGYGKTTFTPDEMIRCHLYTLYLGLVMKTECYYRHYDTDAVSKSGLSSIHSSIQQLL